MRMGARVVNNIGKGFREVNGRGNSAKQPKIKSTKILQDSDEIRIFLRPQKTLLENFRNSGRRKRRKTKNTIFNRQVEIKM